VKKYKLSTLSSLAKVADKITYSANPEHLTRADGLPLLATAYGIDFKGKLKVVDISLRYRPIQQKKADCVYAFGTDPLKKKLGLVTLRDDKNRFPVANSAYVASAPANFGAILNKVTASLTGNDAIDLLTKIDIDKEDPADVASAFLKSKGII
jgi:glycine betaine/choline ABC-type transport system substrate-binding protein